MDAVLYSQIANLDKKITFDSANGVNIGIGDTLVNFKGATAIKSKVINSIASNFTLPAISASPSLRPDVIGSDNVLGKVYFQLTNGAASGIYEYDLYTNSVRELVKLRGTINGIDYIDYDEVNHLLVIRNISYTNQYVTDATKMGTYNVLTDVFTSLSNLGFSGSMRSDFSFDYSTGRMFRVNGTSLSVYNYINNTLTPITVTAHAGNIGSCFSPSDNRIYYFNIVTGVVKVCYYDFDTSTSVMSAATYTLANSTGDLITGSYYRAVYDSVSNRIYFAIYHGTTLQTDLFYLLTNNTTNPSITVSFTMYTGNVSPTAWGYNKLTGKLVYKNQVTSDSSMTVVDLKSSSSNNVAVTIPSIANNINYRGTIVGDTILAGISTNPYTMYGVQIENDSNLFSRTGITIALIQNADTVDGNIRLKIDGNELDFFIKADARPIIVSCLTSFEIMSVSMKINMVWGEM